MNAILTYLPRIEKRPPTTPMPTPSVTAEAAGPSARITAIVPARDEQESIETCVRSLARQPEIAEIFVVNDQSSDGTAEVV